MQLVPAPALSPTSTPPTWLSQPVIGTLIGAWAMIPEPMPPECSDTAVAEEPGIRPPAGAAVGEQFVPAVFDLSPTAVTELPHRSTGTLTGAWTMSPDSTPPDCLLTAVALAPPPVPGAGTGVQVVGSVLSLTATSSAVVPQARIGALIGTWTVLPDPIPPLWSVTTLAEAPDEEVQVVLPTTSLTAAATTVVPHRSRPRSIGTWIVLPARMPPSWETFAVALAPAGAGPERGAGRGWLRFGWSGSALRTLRGAERADGLAT
jgi:hypothetical protein